MFQADVAFMGSVINSNCIIMTSLTELKFSGSVLVAGLYEKP